MSDQAFNQLLINARNEPDYEHIRISLTYIINTTSDLYYVSQFLFPFLAHTNSDVLNVFCSNLQNAQNAVYLFPSLIHNVALECGKNDRVRQVIELLIEKFA